MKFLAGALLLLTLTAPSSAHFVYVVPTDDGQRVSVFMSEKLAPDPDVAIDGIVGGTRLFAVDSMGGTSPLKCSKHDNALESGPLPAATIAVGGTAQYGVVQSERTGNKPMLLVYYPKAIIGGAAPAAATVLGKRVPLEIVTASREGVKALRVLFNGKPLADAVCATTRAGEDSVRAKTDADGFVPAALDTPGRLAVWARCIEKKSGEVDGRHYDEVRHYATLTLDVRP